MYPAASRRTSIVALIIPLARVSVTFYMCMVDKAKQPQLVEVLFIESGRSTRSYKTSLIRYEKLKVNTAPPGWISPTRPEGPAKVHQSTLEQAALARGHYSGYYFTGCFPTGNESPCRKFRFCPTVSDFS